MLIDSMITDTHDIWFYGLILKIDNLISSSTLISTILTIIYKVQIRGRFHTEKFLR